MRAKVLVDAIQGSGQLVRYIFFENRHETIVRQVPGFHTRQGCSWLKLVLFSGFGLVIGPRACDDNTPFLTTMSIFMRLDVRTRFVCGCVTKY
jgi:hypothetical protein